MSATALRSIIIATSEENSTFHHQALAIGEVWRAAGLIAGTTPLFTGGSVENAHLVSAGKADFGCMAANWLPLATTGSAPFRAPLPLRVLPFSSEERQRIMAAVPYYGDAVIATGAFPGHEQDVTTPGVINILAVHSNAPEEWVYQLTRAIITGAKDLAARNRLFGGLDQLLAAAPGRIIPVLEKAGATQHRGAQRAFG